MQDKIVTSFCKLKSYCEAENFKGWDPFDGLNSRLFRRFPYINKNNYARLAWIQLFKKCPINLRKLVLIEKGYNPKGLGLFLSGYCNLYRINRDEEYLEKIRYFIEKIMSLEVKGWSGSCWGYNFDWQARAFFHPKNTPTVVASVFVGYALLDAYEILKEDRLLNTSRSICEFILKDLNRTYDKNGNYVFSYSPLDKSSIFNASLLGSKLLSRVYSYTKENNLISEARKSVEFCCSHQKEDGSWTYGILPFHQWIDNFHSGYNLECISEYQKYSGDATCQENLEKGLNYYLKTFFTSKGEPKYYHNSLYPIDIHAPAQLITTLVRLNGFEKNIDLINNVAGWAVENMQDNKGFFYYQLRKRFSCRIPYIRWAQGWMFYALSLYLCRIQVKIKKHYNKINIFNIPIDAITMKQTLDLIVRSIACNKQLHHTAINAGKIVKMYKDNELHTSIISSDIINADGQSVVWASRILGNPLPERVAGIDLMENIARLAKEKNYTIFLFGAKEYVVTKVVEIYSRKYSPDIIAGYRNGYFSEEEESKIARQINISKANILFVAMTSPFKEKFLYKYRKLLKNVNFIMGVGGSFDVVAGKVKRAPLWMQKIGMEWFFRLMQEPGRMWKRYTLDNLKFIYLLLKEKLENNIAK